jgi:lipoprotein signal peptidase
MLHRRACSSSRLLVEAGRNKVEIGTECRAGYPFAAFNLADSAITVGVAMLAIDGLFGEAEAAKNAST